MEIRSARKILLLAAATLFALGGSYATDRSARADDAKPAASDHDATDVNKYFRSEEGNSDGTVNVEGNAVDYHAVAGTLIVHPKGWDDAAGKSDGDTKSDSDAKDTNPTAEAAMFYVGYFKSGEAAHSRPITFVYNGGPGSSSVWLHMGAFGPRRIVTADDTHTAPAPYRLVDNAYSLMDASDLVFVDAPGTGFGRLRGKDKEKAFWGTDPDVHAFSEFIKQFLSKYGRWNSPKYLFGESYGTPRSAALINVLETEDSADFNGVILLSQVLNYDLSTGGAQWNPSVDLPYQLALPSYAATAWYHHLLPDNSRPIDQLLAEVEKFTMTDYAFALRQGSDLSDAERDKIAAKLHEYTGLPVDYIERANLRIDGGEFEKNLQGDTDTTTGRLDSRFSGPSLDPLSERAGYDPQSAAIGSAYVSAFNDYVRKVLHYGEGKTYNPSVSLFRYWDRRHTPPGQQDQVPQAMNVMPDLANAMKYNPQLKILLNGGYFDLATPFFNGMYEMKHLQIPAKLQANIQYHYYQSGHMVYAHEESLKELHDTVADFIHRTDNVVGP